MEGLLGVAILGLWLVALALLMRGHAMLPVLVGLAVAWAVISGAGPKVLKDVIDGGILGYSSTVMVIIMGAWLSEIMLQTGIAETAIRGAAELAGDKPIAVAAAMIIVITFLFTSMYGVGAAVMVGVIALPIMLSMGIPAQVAAPLFTMPLIAGTQLNLIEWSNYRKLFNIPNPINDYYRVFIVQLVIWAVMAMVLAWVKIGRTGPVRTHSVNIDSGYEPSGTKEPGALRQKAPWFALLTPVVPVVGVLVFKWPLNSAFFVGVVFGLLATIHQRPLRASADLFQKALYDGFRNMAPVCAVWLVIGCLVQASALPEVRTPLQSLLGGVLPANPLTIVILLALVAPLAIYRGPTCLSGVGAALVPLFLGMRTVNPGFLYVAWKGPHYVHGTTDPINSWTLWTLGYLKVPGATHIRTALPFTWAAAAISAFAALLMLGG